jgi:hypothetical protein
MELVVIYFTLCFFTVKVYALRSTYLCSFINMSLMQEVIKHMLNSHSLILRAPSVSTPFISIYELTDCHLSLSDCHILFP